MFGKLEIHEIKEEKRAEHNYFWQQNHRVRQGRNPSIRPGDQVYLAHYSALLFPSDSQPQSQDNFLYHKGMPETITSPES